MGRFAILAGGGGLPLAIAEGARRRGDGVHIVAIEGEADAGVAAYPHTWVNFGGVGRMLRALKTGGGSMVIAGAVTRPDLMRLRPDLGFLTSLPPILRMLTAGGDDGLLKRVVGFFESQGLVVRGVHEVAPELVMTPGALTVVACAGRAMADAALAREVLAALGDLDVGQAAVVAGGEVLAIEGVEGTDRMLLRLIASGRPGRSGAVNGVLVKAPKPTQELRVDMPTIGPETVARAAAAGLAGIAVVAGRTLVLDKSGTARAADQAGLFVAGLDTAMAMARPPAAVDGHAGRRPPRRLLQLGRHAPRAADLADAGVGRETVRRLAPFATGAAAAVIRSHVLAVAGNDGAEATAARLAGLRQWGTKYAQRRRGAFTVRVDSAAVPGEDALQRIIATLAAAGFAGLALTGGSAAACCGTRVIRSADQAGLFVIADAPD